MIGRRSLLVLGALIVGSVALEVGLRALLFGDNELGSAVRKPSLFADYQSDEDFFKLGIRWRGGGEPSSPRGYHPLLGWVSDAIDPDTLSMKSLEPKGDRRRILLYGDSYSHCVTPKGTRFEDHIERSESGRAVQLVNYGVRGYGLDQTMLLFESTIDRLMDQAPTVLIGVFVDDDLDRCVLDLRGRPKPRFELLGEDLVLRGTPIPTLPEYLKAHPLGIHSYLLRMLERRALGRTYFGPPKRLKEKAALGLALIARLVDGLEARSLNAGFVLFEGEYRTAATEPVGGWRMSTLVEALEARGIPYFCPREVLRSRAEEDGRDVKEYFGEGSELGDHYTAEANAIVAAALVEFASGL